MEPPAQRTGQGLGLEMVVQRRPVAPRVITADLDQPGAKHDAEDKPAEQSNDWHRRGKVLERAQVQQGAEGERKKTCFWEIYLPPVSPPHLPHADTGQRKKTQKRQPP